MALSSTWYACACAIRLEQEVAFVVSDAGKTEITPNMSGPESVDPRAALKKQAAEYAVRYVKSGMAVGLGTGSTAIFAVRRIAELLQSGDLKDILGFATSQASR